MSVPPGRIARWCENFETRHGPLQWGTDEGAVTLTAADGAIAVITSGWGPLEARSSSEIVDDVGRDRTVGVLIVRKGAHAVGIFVGQELRRSKNDTHYVQGRTKAGGWSQQRYARRRENQASKAYAAAADEAAVVLLPELESLEALVCGGDQGAITAVLQDRRLEPLRDLVSGHGVLPTPEPRKATLAEVIERARAVTIHLNDLA